MSNLSHQDLQSLLSAIRILHEDVSPLTLPDRTTKAVLSLVPNEILIFDGFGTDNHYSGFLWYSPPEMVWDSMMPVLAELIHQHPAFNDGIVKRTTKTFRVSNYTSLEKFHRTGLYNEFYKQFDADTQMTAALAVSPESFITCSLHRTKMDFSDRDLEILRIFSPHLISAFRSSQFIHQLEVERDMLETALGTARYGIITIDANLNVSSQNLNAVQLLAKYFKPRSADRLPEEIIRYVIHHSRIYCAPEIYLPPAPLIIQQIGSKLKIRLSLQSQSHTIVVFLEELKEASPADIRELGLTRRESEILLWMAKGKADSDIAALCFISLRTVHKHRENIFQKLGVETRTAAMLRAVEILQTNNLQI